MIGRGLSIGGLDDSVPSKNIDEADAIVRLTLLLVGDEGREWNGSEIHLFGSISNGGGDDERRRFQR